MVAQNEQSAFKIKEKIQVEIEIEYDYLLFLPENKSEAKDGKLPLMIFLHGAGERGDDIDKVKVHGPPKIVAKQKDFPFIVLSPQCKKKERWDAFNLNLLIDHIIANHPVDTDRIYLTGLSMGGYGTWDLAIKYPNKFAAIAPICGGSGTNAWDAHKIIHLPIWVFHGAMDRVVPLENSVKIVRALKDYGAKQVKFTIYPEADHNSWTETYDNAELYEWFLEHSLK